MSYERGLKERVENEIEHYIKLYDGVEARFSAIAEGRSVSSFT
jgi:hypothetical protein